MNLSINVLLEWRSDATLPIVDRILWMDSEYLILIHVTGPNALPVTAPRSEIERALEGKECEIVKDDSGTFPHHLDQSVSDKHRKRRDDAWVVIAPIVSAPDGGMFDPIIRGGLIREAMRRTGRTKRMIYLYLFRYWRCGQTKNALLPWFENCGGKGKERIPGTIKRGRPNLTRKAIGQSAGINIGPDEIDKFRRGIKRFYENHKSGPKLALREAFDRTLETYFRSGYHMINGNLTAVLPPADGLPTFRQFEYWYYRDRDPSASLTAREGQRRFDLCRRAITGDSTRMAFGPGSFFQIDSTMADLYLVSSLDRTRIIGRPILYMLVDVFSRLIVGFNITTENASYLAAALAIENAASDKVVFCRSYGIEITPDDWPCQQLPESIIADRGELEGPKADPIINGLNIQLSNTPPYRADLKGIVERTFRTVNDELVHWLPGHVAKDRERGERDHRLEAVLDLRQFTQLIIRCVLNHNRSLLNQYRLDEFMIGDQLEPRPTVLWVWGIANRSGHLRHMDPDLLRLNLLPAGTATVTPKGIRFNSVFYTCERAVQEQWFARARIKGDWRVEIVFDPRTTDFIYLKSSGVARAEVCRLLDADQRFQGRAWVELTEASQIQKEQRELAATDDRQAEIIYRTQVARIVATAKEQTASVQNNQSKQARLKGIRGNR